MKKEGILYAALHEIPAPEGLSQSICNRIVKAAQQRARLKTLMLGFSSLICGVALVPAFQYMGQEFYASGFYEYTYLLFSNGSLVVGAWKQFGLSLVESLPSVALLLLLALFVALGWSLRQTFVNARVAFSF